MHPFVPRIATHPTPLGRHVLALAIVCTSLVAGCDKFDLSSPAQHIEKARQRLDAKDPKSAEIELKNALQQDGRNMQARLLLGETYVLMHRGQAAEVEASHAEQFGAKPEETMLLRARSYVLQRQYSRVLKDLPEQLTGSPEHVADLNEVRGDAQAALGLLNEADRSYDAVLATRPNALGSLFGKARIAAMHGNFDGAIALVDRGLAADAKSTAGLLLKGDILFAKKDDAGAMKIYVSAVDQSPTNEEARVALGGALIRAGQLDAADEQIKAIFARSPNSIQGNYLKAVAGFARHDLRNAYDAVQKVTSALPDFAPAVLLTSAIEYETKSYLQAEANAQRYVAAFPGSVAARKLLAAIYLKEDKPSEAFATLEPILGQKDLRDSQIFALAGAALARSSKPQQALEYIAKANELSPNDHSLKAALGVSSLASGDEQRGIDTFESLVSVDTSNVDADSILVISYMGRKEFKKAIDTAQALIKSQPKNAAFYNLLGGAYGASGDLVKARQTFEKAVELAPNSAPAAINLARMDLVDKKGDAARERLTSVLKRAPKNLDLLNTLADIEYEQANYEAAGKWLEAAYKENPDAMRAGLRLVRFQLQNREAQKALSLARGLEPKYPNNVELLLLLAQAQAESGDRNGAVSTYGRVAGIRPAMILVYLQIARLEAADGHTSAARAAIQKALVASPDSVEALMMLAELDTGLGRLDDAKKVVARLEMTPATVPQARIVAGNIAMHQRKWDVAVKAFGDALAAQKSPYVVKRLHAALSRAGKKREADDLASDWIARNTADMETRLYLAGVLQLGGDAAKARDLYRQVLEIDPKNILALNELALLLQAVNDPQAVGFAERAYVLQPNSSAVGDTLGWLLVESGDLARGQQILERAVKAAPWNNEARYHYALALIKGGDKTAARSNLKQAIDSPEEFAQRADAQRLLQSL